MKNQHEKMINKTQFKMCEGCSGCDPESYTAVVSLRFLRMAENMYKSLLEVSPMHTAPGWIMDIEDKIKEAEQAKPQTE